MKDLQRALEALRAHLREDAQKHPAALEPRPELPVDVLMERIRSGAGEWDQGPEQEAQLPRVGTSIPPLPFLPRYTLDQLLAYNDADFVRNAYRALLHREPDAQGFAMYLQLLREGTLSKVDVLGSVQASEEARHLNVQVPMLRLAVRLRNWRRIPVVGRLLGISQYLLQLPVVVGNIERQQVAMFYADRQLRDAINALAEATEALGRRIAARGPRMDAAVSARLALANEQITALADDVASRAPLSETLRLAESVVSTLDAVGNGVSGVDERLRVFEERLRRDADAQRELEPFYVAFENRFRGSREDIKARVSVYLPKLKEAGAGTPEAPVVDLGCGRGEWVELLRDSGLTARGIDNNGGMVEECRALGLDVVQVDVLEYLRAQAPGSLGAITGIHIIEHLPFKQLVMLFREAWRTLRPGGVAIFETPNPENLIVGACNFWYDPTHERPLPPLATQFVAESQGFSPIEIMRLHPYPAEALLHDGPAEMQNRLNDLLFGPQDYSVIATRP